MYYAFLDFISEHIRHSIMQTEIKLICFKKHTFVSMKTILQL